MCKPGSAHLKRRFITALLIIYLGWYVSVPRVKIYFSEKGSGDLKFVLNTEHDIFRWKISPGDSTGGPARLFADDNFFMQFDWSNLDKTRCVRIHPKWPTTKIYIGADGEIDRGPDSGTDVDHLSNCPTG
jgi:hypothetical protein